MTRLAYLFERFPSYTQTFCFREVSEMCVQGMDPLVFSIRVAQKTSENDFSGEVLDRVQYLPDESVILNEAPGLAPADVARELRQWVDRPDKLRVFTAAYLGPRLLQAGVHHVHTHFAGIGARTAYWLKQFYGLGYSFTGHANDIFRDADHPVSLEDLVREAQFVATVSEFSRKWLQERLPAYASKIFRVYNGIEIEKFRSGPRIAFPLRIVSVGRYIEKKGFADLIEACRLLDAMGVAFDCQIIGSGPLEPVLAAQIQAANLVGKVVLTGPRNELEVIEAMAGANLFVLPCVREVAGGMDNLPTVIMEAMASELPVISTKVAGVPEMIRHGETGLLIEPNAPEVLARAIAGLAPDALEKMGKRGKALAMEQFALPVTAGQLRSLIERYGRGQINTRCSFGVLGKVLRKLTGGQGL